MAISTKDRAFLEAIWRPNYPYVTDDFATGIWREQRPLAVKRLYVEANPPAISNVLVVDVDHHDAHLRAISSVGSHPLPNAVVINQANGHAHALWGVKEPITRTEYASRKAIAYAAANVEGLRRALDGDKGYSGLMTKNPLHAGWDAEVFHTDLFELAQIEEALGTNMPPKRWREAAKKRGDVAGLGRNCALFESARHWAYREVRHHFGDSEGLRHVISAEVAARNSAFPEPLPTSEARAIATSIHRWITTRSRMWTDGEVVYAANFIAIQAARGRRSGTARTARRIQLAESL